MSAFDNKSSFGFRVRSGQRVVATFEFVDEKSRILYRKHRIEPGQDGRSKTFLFDRPNGNNGWEIGIGDRRVPYRLPNLLRAAEGEPIFMAEGEAKADKLAKWGLTATSFKDWRPAEFAHLVRGRTVFVLPDNDEPGCNQAKSACTAIEQSGGTPVIINLPGLPHGGDIIDWRGSYSDFMSIVMKLADMHTPSKDPALQPVADVGFEFVAASELRYTPPEFVVEDIVEADSLCLGFGDPGSAKSFLFVDIALSVATGTDFHCRPVKQGAVFYIAGEGHNGLGRRFRAWSRHRGVPLDGAPCFVSKRPAQFLDETSAKAVTRAVAQLAERHGPPVLIVIDTLARNFGPGDENSNTEMGKFIAAIDNLRAMFPGCTVLIVHHSGHSAKNRSRGAIALPGALDCEYRIEKVKDCVTLINTKMKDAPQPPPLTFRLEDVDIGNGWTSAVLVETEVVAPQKDLSPMHKLARDSYIRAAVAGESWSNADGAGLHVDEWRERFNSMHPADRMDAKRQAFSRVRRELLSDGVISIEKDVYFWNDAAVVEEIGSKRRSRSLTETVTST